MGYSDLGCYGSEIRTPNLDGLATEGLRFSQMYNFARCCPSRAALLTGLYPHQAGIGHMAGGIPNAPGYGGYLRHSAVTIAQVLKERGYRTLMSGKWHCGKRPDSTDIPPEMQHGLRPPLWPRGQQRLLWRTHLHPRRHPYRSGSHRLLPHRRHLRPRR